MTEEKSNLSFEEALEKLENSVAVLKSKNISLEGSIEVYEKCIMYYDLCVDILDNAKQKVEIYNPQSGIVEKFGE